MQMFLSDKSYNSLKWLAQIGLPAVGALYFGLSQIWGLPNGEEVVGSITVVDLFLGSVLGLSTKSYNDSAAAHDGFLTAKGVDPDTGNPHLQMTITTPPDELLQGKTVRLKVGTPPPPPIEH